MKQVIHLITVPSGNYCWPPLTDDCDIENREMCHYLELNGGISICTLGFDIDCPTKETPFIKKDSECANLLEASASFL